MAAGRTSKGRFTKKSTRKPRARRNPLVMDHGGHRGLAKIKKARRNPIHRHRRSAIHSLRRRRNPAADRSGFWGGVMTGAIVFPVAALLTDVAYGYMPLPSSMQTGIMRPLGKLGVAGLLGLAAKFMLPKKLAVFAAAGALGGVIYDASKSYLATAFPTLPLSGVGDSMSFSEMTPAALPAEEPSYLGQDPNYLGAAGAYLEGTGAYLHGRHNYATNE